MTDIKQLIEVARNWTPTEEDIRCSVERLKKFDFECQLKEREQMLTRKQFLEFTYTL